MIRNNKPDINTRETIELCLKDTRDIELSRQLRLRLSLIGDGTQAPKPLKALDGTEFYVRRESACPYKNCPKALAAIRLRGPYAGEVLTLCADPRVGQGWMSMHSTEPAKIDYYM